MDIMFIIDLLDPHRVQVSDFRKSVMALRRWHGTGNSDGGERGRPLLGFWTWTMRRRPRRAAWRKYSVSRVHVRSARSLRAVRPSRSATRYARGEHMDAPRRFSSTIIQVKSIKSIEY